MRNRLFLHEELCNLLGSRYVYFQPPESVKLTYPCIIYNKANVVTRYADDCHFLDFNRYDLTIISKDPEFDLSERIMKHFKYCSINRRFVNDNLYHDVLELYY